MLPFIDIHSHIKAENEEGIIRINNLLLHKKLPVGKAFYSAGWHPWFINGYTINEIHNSLLAIGNNKNVLAIGECGLDRVKSTPLEIQKKVFTLHIELALKNDKPLIVHCVKCYSDLLETLKTKQMPITIIHRYSGNIHQLEQMLKYDNVFFSLGADLFKDNNKLQKILKAIPRQKIFLETDDSHISIEKIYLRASIILNTHTEVLKQDIFRNFKNIFGNELVEPH